jgi:transcriptional regulator with XRE-family HTH domain
MEARKLVGWNLRGRRVERGYSIEQLAGEAEVDESHIARIERGTVNSSVDVLARLAKALGVKFGELFKELPVNAKPPKPLKSGRRPKA